jgi:hypothetical protein
VIGVKRIIKSDNRLVKLAWGIMILTSLSFGLLNTSNSISDYLNYDVITNIEKITPTNITFPAITVCVIYYLDKSIYIDGKFSRFEKIYDNVSLKHFINQEYSCYKDKPLNLSQLEYFKIPNYVGNCLKFDGTKGFERVNDTKDELLLSIKPHHEEIISSKEKYIYSIKLVDNLFDIYITDNYLNSFFNSNPLQLAEGIHVVSFEKSVLQKRVNSPRFPCLESENEVYRQINCIEICMNKEIKNKYNCSFPSYYTIEDLKPCGNRSNGYKYEVYLTQLKTEFYKVCENKCPKECDSIKLKIKSEESKYYNERNSIRIEFSFSDLSSLEIIQIPKMNLFDIVSSVGGTLGLFIGVTFLSIVELLELSIDVLYILLFKH